MYLKFHLVEFSPFPIFFPSATITFICGTGCTNNLSFFATFMSRKLWVLLVSTSTVTFSFFICPFSFSVCGWLIPVMDSREILGVSSISNAVFRVASSSLSSSLYLLITSTTASHFYNTILGYHVPDTKEVNLWLKLYFSSFVPFFEISKETTVVHKTRTICSRSSLDSIFKAVSGPVPRITFICWQAFI